MSFSFTVSVKKHELSVVNCKHLIGEQQGEILEWGLVMTEHLLLGSSSSGAGLTPVRRHRGQRALGGAPALSPRTVGLKPPPGHTSWLMSC